MTSQNSAQAPGPSGALSRSGLRIRDVEAFPVWVGHRNQLLVKVTADDGSFGWGESGFSGREQAVIGAVRHYRELLVGEDPFLINAMWQKLYRSQYFEGGRVLTAAISAIEIALYDLKGKALGLPVHALIGGRVRDRVPSLATTNAISPDEAIEQAQAYVSLGFDVVRLSRVNPLAAGGVEQEFEPRLSLPKRRRAWCGRGRCWGAA